MTLRILIVVSVCIITGLLVRFLLIHPYRIPSEGMYPTHKKNDIVWGVPLYRFRPQLIVRGDIIAFRTDVSGRPEIFEKRVVGLPGDRVQTRGGTLTVNGTELPQRFVKMEADLQIIEERAGSRTYQIAVNQNSKHAPPEVDVVVPPNCFFVVGDNRFNSLDSRYTGPITWSALSDKIL